MSQRNEYAIFTNRHKKKLVFYPVAKNANSSAKLFFLKHLGLEKKFYFLEDEIPRHKINQSLIPGILKTCTLGYDGKGQYTINSLKDFNETIDFNKEYILDPSYSYNNYKKNICLLPIKKFLYEIFYNKKSSGFVQ